MDRLTTPIPDSRSRPAYVKDKIRAASASVLASVLLTGLKLAAGLATGSLGLLAEAAHSALDLGAALVTWVAVRASWRPPDDEHQYGHGKIENLAALAETGLLVVTSVWILWEAGRRLSGHGPEVEPSLWAFVVIGISIVVDFVRSRDLKRVAERTESQALEADALHFSSDVASSFVVLFGLVGVLLARQQGIPWLEATDPVAAAIVAALVLYLSWKLGRRATDMLLDRAPEGLSVSIRERLLGLDGTEGVPEVRVRQSGDRRFADVELRLRAGLPVAEGERVAAAARDRVREVAGETASVLVQFRAGWGEGASIRERVAVAVSMESFHAHDITVRHDADGCHSDLHLELPGRLTLGEAHAAADRVERRILSEVPEIRRVDIHLELHDDEPEPVDGFGPDERLLLEAAIREVAGKLPGGEGLHDLLLRRTASGVYLSCHCFLDPSTPLATAHAWTDRLEAALHREIPQLVRISVHAEPRGLHE